MKTEFQKAHVPRHLRSLMAFDAKVFRAADRFDREAWLACESWWMRVGSRHLGCCAFLRHVDFQEDLREDRRNLRCPGSLYIVTTGILPSFQRLGFGALLKSWQISYARFHGFHRIVTNTRAGNTGMIALNQKFGFKIVRLGEGYYSSPREATAVMELNL